MRVSEIFEGLTSEENEGEEEQRKARWRRG